MSSPDPRRWLILPVILLATVMASFDYMVVNVAAPSLRGDLHTGPATLELIIGGYAFTYASGMVTGGRLGDLLGYRRMFLLGMAGFTAASLLCSLARSGGELVGARLLQGLAAAAMVPQVLALITAIFPAGERPRALSWFGVALGAGGIAGQVFGGLLLAADPFGLGWRVIFLVNLPVGALAVALAARWLPAGERSGRRPRLDPLGVLGISGSLALALVPLALGGQAGWPAWCWLCLAGSVPALAATLRWERRLAVRGGQPLLDLGLFRARAFTAGLGITVALLASFSSFMLVLTLLLQAGLGLSALWAGLAFAPMGLLAMLSSLLGRPLMARYGRVVLAAGSVLSAIGAAAVAIELWLAGSGVLAAWLVLPVAVVGLGNGLTLPALIGVVLGEVRPDQAGAASGVLSTTQQFAGAAGVAVLGSVFFAALGPQPGRAGYVRAAQLGFWLDVALLVAVTVLVATLPRSPERPVPAAVPAPDAASVGA
jgi:EmrB/QacA subfamily drug resistance transporter